MRFGGIDFPAWIFTPDGQAEDWIVKAMDAAQETIDISMFTFRSTRIAEALLRAKKRRVKVRVLLDESQSNEDYMRPYAEWLAFHGVAVKLLAGPNGEESTRPRAEKNHNKFMVVDGRLVETGSMNWTKNAFYMSFENANFLADRVDVKAFADFFASMFQNPLAKKVAKPGAAPELPSDEELLSELRVQPKPLPPKPVWEKLPDPGSVRFHGEIFPASAARPHDPVKDLLVKAINSSEHTIELALYELTLPEVLAALLRARDRGVKVRLVLDYSHVFPTGKNSQGQERGRSPEIQTLIDEGFDLRVLRGRSSYGSMHNKFAIFDGEMLELGSYNWAKTAEENHFENVKFTDEKARVDFYGRYWEWMRAATLSFEDIEAARAGGRRLRWPDPGATPMDEDLAIEHNGQRFPRQVVSPQGGVEAALIRAIEAATTSIDIAMFSFFSVPIAKALLEAKDRDVVVRLALDGAQAKLMKLDNWFAYHGFEVALVGGPDDQGNVMYEKNHHKFMLVDGRLLADGSFNYSDNAENNNYENISFFTGPADAAFFGAVMGVLFAHGYSPEPPMRAPDIERVGPEFFAPPADPARAARVKYAQTVLVD